MNGIDYSEWSPQRDPFLRSDGYVNYSPADLAAGKARCKAALQRVRTLLLRPDGCTAGHGRSEQACHVKLHNIHARMHACTNLIWIMALSLCLCNGDCAVSLHHDQGSK